MTTEHITEQTENALPKDISGKAHNRADAHIGVNVERDESIKDRQKTRSVADVAGMLKTNLKLTIEEMDEKVADAFRRGDL